MSVQYGKVISLILNERFGPLIEKVGTCLFSYGTSPLMYIKRNTELPLSKVKESLCVLIKYRLVTFKPNKNENVANYTLQPEKIMLMLRYPVYINLIKKKFGDEAEVLLEEILQSGSASASELIMKAFQRIKKDKNKDVSLPEIRDKLHALITAKYISRLPYAPDDKPVPYLQIKEKELYAFPTIDIRKLALSSSDKNIEFPDADIYWTVNFDRFHQDMRDKMIVNAFTRKFDENIGEFVRVLLQQMYIRTEPWSETSNPIPLLEIKDLIKKYNTHPQLVAFFDQYVNVIENDQSQLIRKTGEAGGGSLQIFIKEIFTQLTWETIEQIVLEKFETKAARIFRLVKSKHYIEPEQIQQLAMIPAKEAKRLSYQLLAENFLEVQELKKPTSNTGINKSYTLFYVQLRQVARMVLELCYKTLYNIMIRRQHEKVVNRRIIDKKQRVDTISLSMRIQGAKDEQLADIEEMITPPEREILEKIDKNMRKLIATEFEVDETIFLLELFLTYE